MIFLNNLLVIKNIITEGYTDEMKRVIFFLPTENKLPMKDSRTGHFRW
jgi:hypothetical protein